MWPSAVFMAEELLGRPELVAGKTVCEVGCGLGLAGLAAALSGECCVPAVSFYVCQRSPCYPAVARAAVSHEVRALHLPYCSCCRLLHLLLVVPKARAVPAV